jgi:hypothetical protein
MELSLDQLLCVCSDFSVVWLLLKKKRDVDRYKRLRQEVQYEVRRANKKYMEDVNKRWN